MERYSLYKDSGISWIGEIPGHWEQYRFATLFKEKSICNHLNEELLSVYLDRGVIKFSEDDNRRTNPTSKDLSKYQLVAIGDFVLNNQQAWRGSVGVSKYRGIISPAYFIFEMSSKLNPLYANYLLRSSTCVAYYYICSKGIGSIQRNLDWSSLKQKKLAIPPLNEQQAIVAYIEEKCQMIDAYVADKEKEIELLQELKQKTIADAVTKGLNPDAKMKDSGISWIGGIPEHWEVRHLSQVSYEHYISNKEIHHQNLLSLSYGRIIRKDINTTEGLLPASFDTYQIVEEGNIVMRLTDLQNDHKSLRVGLVKEEGIVTSAYVCLGVFDSMIPSFLYNVLHSYDIKKLFYSMGGGLRQNLNWQGLKKLDIPLPPKDEQQAIVAYIEEKCQKIDKLASELQSEIDYLKEYKQRLIADCVTGQVNVQNV